MFYRFIIFVIKCATYIWFNIKFEGLENIPTDKGFILAGNHRTYYDPIFAVIKLPMPMNFMAKEELFNNKLLGWLINKLNAFPVARGAGDGTAMNKAFEVLKEGKPLLMFIEGTRSKTMAPGRPRSGAAAISARAGVGVIPFSLDYGEKLSFRAKVVVRYHPMLTQAELGTDLESPRTMRTASKKIMDVIISGLTHLPSEEEKA